MSNPDYRIPDDMAVEVLAEAARLYAEASKGFSFADLQQACSEAQIPPHTIRQAIKNVEDKRLREQTKRQQFQEYIKQQVKKGMTTGIAFLIPALAISSIFIFQSQLKPVLSKLLSSFKPDQQQSNASLKTLTIERGKLKYFTDPKGLSIAISDVSLYEPVNGTIGTDGYESLNITNTECKAPPLDRSSLESYEYERCQNSGGKVGQFYNYKGIYNYRIKIIEINRDSATFQIDQQGQESQSAVKRLEEKIEQLQKQGKELKGKINELQIENAVNKQNL
ncbi:hypothetical protein [Nostoc sp.]|uniref:hypothetical protein n=1 Tax=Nostoc sp. TaxID=1180 RepID=UPI003594115C